MQVCFCTAEKVLSDQNCSNAVENDVEERQFFMFLIVLKAFAADENKYLLENSYYYLSAIFAGYDWKPILVWKVGPCLAQSPDLPCWRQLCHLGSLPQLSFFLHPCSQEKHIIHYPPHSVSPRRLNCHVSLNGCSAKQ